jgi:hypothetical protein
LRAAFEVEYSIGGSREAITPAIEEITTILFIDLEKNLTASSTTFVTESKFKEIFSFHCEIGSDNLIEPLPTVQTKDVNCIPKFDITSKEFLT